MKRAKPRIVLKNHFVTQWHERVSCDSPGRIKSRLRNAMLNKPIMGIPGGFVVTVQGCKALCVIDSTDSWVFLTVLTSDMILKEGDVG